MLSATNDLAPDEQASGPLTIHLIGNLLTFRALGTDTDGRFSLVDARTAPGQGSPVHTQRDEEAFLVLEGSYEFRIGEATRRCEAGGFLYVPPGTAHGFRNPGDAPARMLIISLPAGLHEAFYREAGDPVPPGTQDFPPITPPDIDRLVAAAARQGMVILPPTG